MFPVFTLVFLPLFVRHVGMTPSDYIRRFRLSRSALRLRDGKIKVVDAAFEMGFKSVDGYQRAFSRELDAIQRNML